MLHDRIRRFNTRDTYPDQRLDNDFCQVVKAQGTMVFVRGQVGQDLDTSRSVGIGDAAAQTEQAMANVRLLLEEAGSRLEHICRIQIYLTDRAYRDGRPMAQRDLSGLDRPHRAGARPSRMGDGDRGHRGCSRRLSDEGRACRAAGRIRPASRPQSESLGRLGVAERESRRRDADRWHVAGSGQPRLRRSGATSRRRPLRLQG